MFICCLASRLQVLYTLYECARNIMWHKSCGFGWGCHCSVWAAAVAEYAPHLWCHACIALVMCYIYLRLLLGIACLAYHMAIHFALYQPLYLNSLLIVSTSNELQPHSRRLLAHSMANINILCVPTCSRSYHAMRDLYGVWRIHTDFNFSRLWV